MNADRKIILSLVTILAIIMISGCDNTRVPPEPVSVDYLLAVVGLSTLSLLDMDTGELHQENIGIGLGANWIIEHQNRLFVISSLSNNIHVFYIDHAESRITYTQSIDLGLQQNNNPYAAATSYNKMYITNLMQNSITVLDVHAMQIDTTWQVGQSPEGIILDGTHVYVVNSGYDFSAGLNGHNVGSVYKCSLLNGEVIDSVEVGLNPQFIARDINGNFHVTCTGDYGEHMGEIHVLDGNLEYVDIIPVNAYPGRINLLNGQMYVACGGWISEGDTSGLILAYDPDNPEDIRYMSVDNGAMDVQNTISWSDIVYVSCFDDLTICKMVDDSLETRYELEEPPVTLVVVGVAAN